MVVGLCGTLLFLFVPESYWDRTPVPRSRRPSKSSGLFARYFSPEQKNLESPKDQSDQASDVLDDGKSANGLFTTHNGDSLQRPAPTSRRQSARGLHVGFAGESKIEANAREANFGGANESVMGLDTALNTALATPLTPQGMLWLIPQDYLFKF